MSNLDLFADLYGMRISTKKTIKMNVITRVTTQEETKLRIGLGLTLKN